MLIRRYRLFAFPLLLLLSCGSTPAEAAETGYSDVLAAMALPLRGPDDLNPLIEAAGSSRLVLLGEASHGTTEFYSWRALISKRLIEEKGFDFVVVEGDWASLFRLNRYVKHLPGGGDSAASVLTGFTRWPVWMWSNREILELAEWLREHNASLAPDEMAGFYGMDLYGEDQAIEKVLSRLSEVAPGLSVRVEEKYREYARHGEDYTMALARGASSCEEELVRVVRLLEENADAFNQDSLAYMGVLQSAVVVMNAERHRRAGLFPGPESWNYRAGHFWETCRMLLDYYGPGSRGIVWAHNTHVGDARATPMGQHGQINIGQLAREEMGHTDVFSVGFGTHRGTVSAGASWGSPRERMTVPEGVPGSLEDMMNSIVDGAALFIFRDRVDLEPLLSPVPHRAMGVVYNPASEHRNYVPTILPLRYDAFIFIGETTALLPL